MCAQDLQVPFHTPTSSLSVDSAVELDLVSLAILGQLVEVLDKELIGSSSSAVKQVSRVKGTASSMGSVILASIVEGTASVLRDVLVVDAGEVWVVSIPVTLGVICS